MSKKIIVILASIIFVIGLAFMGGIYYINENIKPAQVKSIIKKQIESNLENINVNIKDLNYDLGFKVDFKINGLILTEKDTKVKVASIEEAHLNVSVLSILFGGGNIDVLLDAPYAKVYKTKDDSINWKKYSKSKKVSSKKEESSEKTKSDNEIELEVPSIVENSKVNFRLNDLKIDYIDGKTNTFVVKKIIIKDLNLKRTTAYDIAMSLDYAVSEEQKLKTNIAIMGELSLQNLLSDKDFKGKTFIEIRDTTLSNSDYEIPNVNTEVSFALATNSDLKATLKTKSDNFIDLVASLNIIGQKLEVKISKSKIRLAPIIKLIGSPALNSNDSSLLISGDLSSDLSFSNPVPNLELSLSKPIIVENEKVNSINTRLNLSLKGKSLTGLISNSLMGGTADINVKTSIDLANPPSDAKSMSPIYSEVRVANIKIPKSLLNSKESKSNEDDLEKVSGSKVTEKKTAIDLPTTTTKLQLKNISLESSVIEGSGTITTRARTISSNNLNLSLDKSTTKINFKLKTNKVMSTNFSLNTKNLNLKSLTPLMPKIFKEVTGEVNATASGDILLADNLQYNIKSDVNAKDGSIKGLNMKVILEGVLGSLGKYLPKKKSNITENYDLLKVSSITTEKQIKINSFKLVGKDKSIDLNLKGYVSMSDRKSELKGDLEVQTLNDDLRKNIGSTKIPLKLEGSGFVLKPSTSYTSGKLVKKAASKQVDKAKEKIKNKIKDKAKELFKGFKL